MAKKTKMKTENDAKEKASSPTAVLKEKTTAKKGASKKKTVHKTALNTDANNTEKKVIFIQYDMPPLKSGEYTITLEQNVNLNTGLPYSTTRKFAVTGERFTLSPSDINSVFPPNLANGEFDGVFPLVVFNRRTLPWERTSVATDETAPWLAVLLFNSDEAPEIRKMKAKDLVPLGTTITVEGSNLTGTGTMPAGIISYPGMNDLNYGETPDDPVNIIDVPAALFSRIVPSLADLPFLAHIRDTETIDKTDDRIVDEELFAVVTGNRIPKVGANSYAFLVSLENMGALLPGNDGTNHLPVGTSFVRLTTFFNWHFTVNDGDQTFKQLLENLNKNELGELGLTTLQYPFEGTPPPAAAVEQALKKQAAGTLSAADAQILVHNAFTMGYMPMNHTLRHPGNTVSWFRSPVSPFYIKENLQPPFSTPDAINRYDPETGMFDVSYGAAWQIGQLLALQNQAFSTALYNWKKSQTILSAMLKEQELIADKYKNITAFDGIMLHRNRVMLQSNESDIPENIVLWLSQLAVLKGLPFNYLVPDERMLPPESMRFFYMNNNWVNCLLDGAFSIGRSATADDLRDVDNAQRMMPAVKSRSKLFRPRKPMLKSFQNNSGIVTGLLLRSAVVGGWPGLEITGYSDKEGQNEIQKLRMEALSTDTLICIFDGEIQMVALHEPPEALHEGVVRKDGGLASTLRVINGTDPGSQIVGAFATVPARTDNQTIKVKQAADNIKNTLNGPPYNENIKDFTSAEYALEMIKGVVKVEFFNQ
jgi:hypothetical protein